MKNILCRKNLRFTPSIHNTGKVTGRDLIAQRSCGNCLKCIVYWQSKSNRVRYWRVWQENNSVRFITTAAH